MVVESFSIDKISSGQKIIIYGAGRYGELAYYGLGSLGLIADYYIDNNHVGERLHDISVISPDRLNEFTDDIILIASLNYYRDMVIAASNAGANNIYNILELIKLDYDTTELSEYLLDEKINYEKYKNVVDNMLADLFVINHCELVITERCSLRCKDCANLMQYYKNPQHIPYDEIVYAFDNFLKSIDKLLDLRILGGEPFVYPELYKIIKKYAAEDKISRITIYTNSTVIPNDNTIYELKKCNKVVVHMSDYGEISRKISELDHILTENKIEHYIHKYAKWRDIGEVYNRHYNDDELKKIYQTCTMGKCYTFYRGKLYLCPRAAHGERLCLIKNKENEYIDFTNKDDENLRTKIEKLIFETSYINACNYCNGSSQMCREINAAIQVDVNE